MLSECLAEWAHLLVFVGNEVKGSIAQIRIVDCLGGLPLASLIRGPQHIYNLWPKAQIGFCILRGVRHNVCLGGTHSADCLEYFLDV